MRKLVLTTTFVAAIVAHGTTAAAQGTVSGDREVWHKVTIDFAGPDTSEDGTPNPFRDHRMDVTFSQGGTSITVPGYYACDGNAANSGARAGDVWRVHFMPPSAGNWSYEVRHRSGSDVALDDDASGGSPGALDGASGSFDVSASSASPPDMRGHGLLRYVGGHYFQFAGSGEYYLKGGADSPENFLAFDEFDDTPASHSYGPHSGDWANGDPQWDGNRGRNIIGALNYLASTGMNSVYFLTMNVGGDGDDVWPWTTRNERFRFDCSKLDQWEIVFSHMTAKGIQLHVLTQETENDQLLDGGNLGNERRLYYRELIARFGHHPALHWNLGEENTNTDQQRADFAEFIRANDPYDHPITVHTYPGQQDTIYPPLIGNPNFEGPSLQIGGNGTHAETIQWIDASASSRPWVVNLDEIGPANNGVLPDADDPDHDDVRRYHLWGNLMAGGGGVEWYFGYAYPNDDLDCEDWRSRANMWEQTRIALEFFQNHLPFTQMRHSDDLTSANNDYVFAQPGVVYAIYLPQGQTTTDLDLGGQTGPFTVQWYNPRTGGALQSGASITGPGSVAIGDPPANPGQDWVALVRLDGDVDLYTLTVNGGSGDGEYPEGARVGITADPPPNGMSFDTWTGDVATLDDPNAAQTTVTMPAAATTISSTYTDGPSGPEVTGFVVYDADTDEVIPALDPIADGQILNLATLPSRNLAFVAMTEPAVVGSVRFDLDGQNNFQTENVGPYALHGDQNGDFDGFEPSVGNHTLTATAYTGMNGGGMASAPYTIDFEVVDDPNLNVPPTVRFVLPEADAVLTGPEADVVWEVEARDADGTIGNLRVMGNGDVLFDEAAEDASNVWLGVPTGRHTLTAVATDDDGEMATATININVDDGATEDVGVDAGPDGGMDAGNNGTGNNGTGNNGTGNNGTGNNGTGNNGTVNNGSGPDAGTSGGGGGGGDDGCGCRAVTTATDWRGVLPLSLLVSLVLVYRRRRSSDR